MNILCHKVTILKLPKGQSRGLAQGFCDGRPVGRVEAARKPSLGCWWPDDPQLLTFDGPPATAALASGQLIPGAVGDSRAVAWSFRDGQLQPLSLPSPPFERSWATAAGGGWVVGTGTHRPHPQSRQLNAGWVWRDGQCVGVQAEDRDVLLQAVDGKCVAGSVQGQAALWIDPEGPYRSLHPAKYQASEVTAVDGEFQFGKVWKGFTVRPALWQGSAESFQDLTPEGFSTGVVSAAAGGLQVGYLQHQEKTANDTPGSDYRACLWQGSSKNWLDLQDFLPQEKYNASRALAIYRTGSEVQVCGEASFFEVQRPGTRYEGHLVSKAHPVLWRLR